MTELESAVAELRRHEGVEHVLLIGRDGLLIQQSGESDLDTETVAALAPGLAAACSATADAAAGGEFLTAVVEWENGVGILASVSDELLLVVLIGPNVGFAPLLRSVRNQRPRLLDALR